MYSHKFPNQELKNKVSFIREIDLHVRFYSSGTRMSSECGGSGCRRSEAIEGEVKAAGQQPEGRVVAGDELASQPGAVAPDAAAADTGGGGHGGHRERGGRYSVLPPCGDFLNQSFPYQISWRTLGVLF